MRLFLDSANPADWKVWAARGLLYGVTTNPTIFRRAGRAMTWESHLGLINAARELGLNEIQFQVHGLENPLDAASRVRKLYDKWPEGVVAKVPLTEKGFATLPHLPPEIPLTFTAGYYDFQGLLAAAKGARYIAPYYGRLAEAGEPADDILMDMAMACDSAETRVLVASLRSAEQVTHLAGLGFDCFTLSPAVMASLLEAPLSVQAVDAFEADA